jgi:hypothetical protein
MTYASDALAQANKLVALAERHVSAQQEVLTMMGAAGAATQGAELLLAQFTATLRGHEAERDRIEMQLGWDLAQAA